MTPPTAAGGNKKKRTRSQQRNKPRPLVRPPQATKAATRAGPSISKGEAIGTRNGDGNGKGNDGRKNDDDAKKPRSNFASTAESLALIRAYHTLNKRLEQIARDDTLVDAAERERRVGAVLLSRTMDV